MAQFAPVMPIHLMEALWEIDPYYVGQYHLWLAHDVIESEDKKARYAAMAENIRRVFGGNSFIVMDNSICELGDAVGLQPAFEAAHCVRAECVVMPDVMGDGLMTLDRFFSDIRDAQAMVAETEIGLMCVPQGPSLTTFIECLEVYAKHNIRFIGIPRIATNQLGSRVALVDANRILNPKSRIHLLGFSDNVFDDINVARLYLGNHEGIDSAVPVRAGWKDVEFQLSESNYGKRENYWEAAAVTNMMEQNISNVRDWLGNRRIRVNGR